MFGRHKNPTLTDDERPWFQKKFNWLIDQFGRDWFEQRPTIVPTEDFFPDPYDGSKQAARQMFDRVRDYMDVPLHLVSLNFYSEADGLDSMPGYRPNHQQGSSGDYQRGSRRDRIRIREEGLSDPVGVIATLAHELAHVHLLGENRVWSDEKDHEPLTDLTTVFFGLGIFNANSVISDSTYSQTDMVGWSVSRQGYLTEKQFGYGLAMYAWAREELKASWFRHVRPTVRSYLKQNLAFMRRDRWSPGQIPT